jgi:transposase
MVKRDKMKRGGVMKTWISVVEGYRPGRGLPPKQRVVKSFGYLEDQADPVAFMAEVEEFNATYKEKDVRLKIEAAGTEKMYNENNRTQNYGYKFLEAVYNSLQIDKYIERFSEKENFKGEYSLNEIFKFLVFNRIMNPDSKRATFQMKNNFYGMDIDFKLKNIYRALDKYAEFEIGIQRHLNTAVKKTIGRDLSHAFYDVTNYFCEIDFPDGEDDLRRKGVSKEHRTDPIIQMGLFIDGNGLPVNMSLFQGNTSDTLTLQPTMSDVKKSYGLGRLVVVADKGINSSNNINTIVNNGDGYVFSQILRGKKGQRYHEKLFDENGWIYNADNSYKYKLFEEEYDGKDKDGKTVKRKRKVLIYWDKSHADMAIRKREEKLLKAEKNVKNNAYSIKKGVDEYVAESVIDSTTGAVLDEVKKIRNIDFEKAENDALFDGYFCIVTSELDYDERKIRQTYGGLWKIEQSFRILKSDLYARPIFVSTNEHIRAHFLICFVALLIIRVIQHKMGKDAISAERIARALNAATCRIHKGNIIQLDDVGGVLAFVKALDKHGNIVDTLKFSGEDEIALDYQKIQKTFGTDIYNIYLRKEKFDKALKNIL